MPGVMDFSFASAITVPVVPLGSVVKTNSPQMRTVVPVSFVTSNSLKVWRMSFGWTVIGWEKRIFCPSPGAILVISLVTSSNGANAAADAGPAARQTIAAKIVKDAARSTNRIGVTPKTRVHAIGAAARRSIFHTRNVHETTTRCTLEYPGPARGGLGFELVNYATLLVGRIELRCAEQIAGAVEGYARERV